MNFKRNIPHDLYPRLAQALAAAGAAGLLYFGACEYTEAYIPAMEANTQAETAPDSSPETAAEAETEASQKQAKAEALPETESLAETEASPETEALAEAETSPDTENLAEAEIDTELIKVAKKPSDSLRIETELAEHPSETEPAPTEEESSPVEFYGPPYADAGTSLYLCQNKLKILFQPDYLDLTNISLSWEHLEEELLSLTEGYSGNWSVYVKDLPDGKTISINETPMESASLIKLFIMGAVMEQIQNGDLAETETITSLLHEMITVSDNEAANELVRYLGKNHDHKDGLDYLNDFAKRHGFTQTRQVNGLEDPSLRHDPTEINKTSARDCGELLAQIYDGDLVSHLSSRKMEDLLLAQEVTYKIPSALPEGVVSANKTGEISDAENDSAIIYSPGGDFILCIMSGKWDSGNQAITHIREITKMVYNHFNPPSVSDSAKEE